MMISVWQAKGISGDHSLVPSGRESRWQIQFSTGGVSREQKELEGFPCGLGLGFLTSTEVCSLSVSAHMYLKAGRELAVGIREALPWCPPLMASVAEATGYGNMAGRSGMGKLRASFVWLVVLYFI